MHGHLLEFCRWERCFIGCDFGLAQGPFRSKLNNPSDWKPRAVGGKGFPQREYGRHWGVPRRQHAVADNDPAEELRVFGRQSQAQE